MKLVGQLWTIESRLQQGKSSDERETTLHKYQIHWVPKVPKNKREKPRDLLFMIWYE